MNTHPVRLEVISFELEPVMLLISVSATSEREFVPGVEMMYYCYWPKNSISSLFNIIVIFPASSSAFSFSRLCFDLCLI